MDNRIYSNMNFMRNMHSDINAYADPMRFMVPETPQQYDIPDDNGNDTTVKYGPVSTPDSTASGESFPSSSFSSTSSSSSQEETKQNKKRKTVGTPYIPSYMDLSQGPEPCVVCTDAATGYHYRCMTCEGCKGFFRTHNPENLQYHCKWNQSCIIDKTTRNQCQYCRFKKCLYVGMAVDLVLNEKQRRAKRKLIEDNRKKRQTDDFKPKTPADGCLHELMTENDRLLINEIVQAYDQTNVTLPPKGSEVENSDPEPHSPEAWQKMAEAMTPSIVKVVEFAKGVPGFIQLYVDDQILLLKSCCLEVMCLRAACRYDAEKETLLMHNGMLINKSQIKSEGLGVLVEPIFEFAVGLSKLQLDKTELSLLSAVLLMQSDRSGLKEPEAVEKLQDEILGAFKRYVAEKRPHQPVHWAKILMKVTDLRTISTRHAERVLCIRLDHSGDVPSHLLNLFDNNGGQDFL
ncbi:NR1A2 [Mytilus edulis]|uniref:THRB n=1 Tax=Mytilus edulis TaxID=6550 RepID=A0A8S3TIV6_MYTED|nr:NR1A2 [Mytilus edulis]